MKTTVFELTDIQTEVDRSDVFHEESGFYKVPTLPAYAILHTQIQIDVGSSYSGESVSQPRCSVREDEVWLHSLSPVICMGLNAPATLTVSYSGIKDYALLFPHISDPDLKIRLGQFAEEAEKAFEAGAWMSFVLMSGAVIEGLLVDKFGRNKMFNQLIGMAGEAGILIEAELDSCHSVRQARNKIHPDKADLPFVDRCLAMDVYVIYDKLIKRRWDLEA